MLLSLVCELQSAAAVSSCAN